MREVYLDIDGVVLDLLSSLKLMLNESGFDFDPASVRKYDFSCQSKDVMVECRNLLSQVRLFSSLKEYDGAKDAINLLKMKYEVYGYTLVPPNPLVMTCRSNQLKDLGLSGRPYVGRKVLPRSAYAVVEDNAEHLLELSDRSDLRLYLIDRPYNMRDLVNPTHTGWDRIIRCRDLGEVAKYLVGGESK